ncbi:MAG: hypothetical protein IKP46_08430 [Bacteroidales bacterium]|nr:hypothetical protein [Bacteroidales bacterium]
MKRILTIIALGASILASSVVYAQEQTDKAAKKAARKEAVKEHLEAHFKPYGFIRSYAFYDSRNNKCGSEDMFYFMPLDREMVNGADINAVGKFGFQAISTRLGLDIKGYKIGNTNIEAKIEADFYCLNSSGNIGTFRMRQAYAKLFWEPSEKFSHSLLIGQTWHPIAADLANTIALETGAPFSAFNRSAQIMYNATVGPVTFAAGFIEQLQYRSSGPDGSTNKYQRHAIVPEAYAGISVKAGGFLGRAGVSVLSIRPHYGFYNNKEDDTDPLNGRKYNEWLSTVNAFMFLQYTGKIWQIKAKAIYVQSGEHMQLSGGYAATKAKDDLSYEYTPTQSVVTFLSGQVGKKFQFIGMVGYQKNLGLVGGKEMLDASLYYFSGNSFKNVNQMMRFSPTLAYNLGKFTFAVEYDYTMAQYGGNSDGKVAVDVDFNKNGTVTKDLHWVGNHRVLAMAKFSF